MITFFTASLAAAIVKYGTTVNSELSALGSIESALLKAVNTQQPQASTDLLVFISRAAA